MQKINSQEASFPQFPVNNLAVKKFEFSPERVSDRNILFFQEYREFRMAAHKINSVRGAESTKVKKSIPYAKPSDLNATALLNLIYTHLFNLFSTSIVPDFIGKLNTHVESSFSATEKTQLIDQVKTLFPYKLQITSQQNFSDFLIRSIIIRLNNENPALKEYLDLFSDAKIFSSKQYAKLFTQFDTLFGGLPSFGDSPLSLLDFLREPFKLFPNSLYDQLAFIQKKWGVHLEGLLDSLLLALDFLKEENKPVFTGFGPPETPDYGLLNDEYEAFTDDKNWMPNVVMLAKSTLVWMDQLSKKYHIQIDKLNQIPNAELDIIQKQGFTSIWLIGIWERSKASKRIKHIYGNDQAEASAYSLFAYEIADQLGGWPALEDLRARCNQRNIRLASDMVPNHTAIDSKWIIEEPQLFLQLPYNPIPHYTFSGENLSQQEGLGIYLEDKYYSRSDCAVVFKRKDFNTGQERYIYHGNDGTGLPWNDTAQLDYLNPETREAVIQTILHVAKNFSIIRFDAAMTLTKKHIQRLWYPAPGQGGDISTRAEHALSTTDFNNAIPKEFWREIVDRIAAEVPDTLLLAEAFWMLEGYFVRTLGMHRVYNSAFMHMLRDEKNGAYRYLIKETLEFDPQILKRYVNFMNNPDEETAAEQFGKGDKYFGICMLLCTLPGLPMFGHCQIEGFYEKYGMEFKVAQWNESPDLHLIKRHEQEIFPLIRKRYLYSEVHNFNLYNFKNSHHHIDENVFAYSNFTDKESTLIVYNNRYESTAGTLYEAVPVKDKQAGTMNFNTLGTLISKVAPKPQEPNEETPLYLVFTEQKTKLDYIRKYDDVINHGLSYMLSGYEYQIFQKFQAVEDKDGFLTQIHDQLNGAGLSELLFEAEMLKYKSAHYAFSAFLSPELLTLAHNKYSNNPTEEITPFLEEQTDHFLKRAVLAKDFPILMRDKKRISSTVKTKLEFILSKIEKMPELNTKASKGITALLEREQTINPKTIPLLLSWAFITAIKEIDTSHYFNFALNGFIKLTAKHYYKEAEIYNNIYENINLLEIIDENKNNLVQIIKNPKIIQFLKMNNYNKIIWFDLIPFEKLLILRLINQILSVEQNSKMNANFDKIEIEFFQLHNTLIKSEYQLSRFLATIKE